MPNRQAQPDPRHAHLDIAGATEEAQFTNRAPEDAQFTKRPTCPADAGTNILLEGAQNQCTHACAP